MQSAEAEFIGELDAQKQSSPPLSSPLLSSESDLIHTPHTGKEGNKTTQITHTQYCLSSHLHRHRHSHTRTHTQQCTHTHTHTCAHTLTHTQKCTHTHSHAHTHTQQKTHKQHTT